MNYRRCAVRLVMLLLGTWIVSCASIESDDGLALVGKPAPDFTLTGLDRLPMRLSTLKGNVVVVDFWATWCPPCRASLPNLNRLSNDSALASRGLKVLAVNSQESMEDVKKFLDSNHFTLPVVLDSDGSAERSYGVTGLPTTVVVGRDGMITYAAVGFDSDACEPALKDAIEKALGNQEMKSGTRDINEVPSPTINKSGS